MGDRAEARLSDSLVRSGSGAGRPRCRGTAAGPARILWRWQCVFAQRARALRDRVDGARDRALYYRDILLPLHERIVNEAQLQYNAMQLGPFQLLRAREQQIQTAVAYIESLRDYWLARADVEQILSGRLPKLETSIDQKHERAKRNSRQ